MSFYKKYELERLIADGETKTFRAIENSSGRPVFLHMFNPEAQAVLTSLQARLAKDPRNPIPPLIELGNFAGTPYAVTEPLAEFKSLREWLERPAASVAPPVVRPEPSPPPTIAAPAKPPSDASDEFEKLFGEPRPAVIPAPNVPAGGEFTKFFGSAPAAAAPKPAAEPQGGEFTKFFGEPPPKPAVSKPPAPPASDEFTKMFGAAPEKPAAKPPVAPEADEFTKMFGGPTPGSAPAKAAPPQEETGQFTKLFGSGPSGEAINIEEEQARAARSAAPENRPFQAPGAFTRVFGPGHAAGGGAAPPAPRPLTIGNASGIFKAQGSMGAAPPPVPPKMPGVGAGSPGEYTQMMAAPKERGGAPAQNPGMPPPVTPVPAPKRGMMIAIGVGVAVVLIAIFAAIVMMTRK